MKHFMLDLTHDRRSTNRLVFGAANGASLDAELLDAAGSVTCVQKRASPLPGHECPIDFL